MSLDLVVSEQGEVMIATTSPFAAEVTRVDYDILSNRLTLNYADDALPPTLLDHEVNARLSPALRRAARVLLVVVNDNTVTDGYDVPLTCIEH